MCDFPTATFFEYDDSELPYAAWSIGDALCGLVTEVRGEFIERFGPPDKTVYIRDVFSFVSLCVTHGRILTVANYREFVGQAGLSEVRRPRVGYMEYGSGWSLPDDITAHIMGYLTISELARSARVSKRHANYLLSDNYTRAIGRQVRATLDHLVFESGCHQTSENDACTLRLTRTGEWDTRFSCAVALATTYQPDFEEHGSLNDVDNGKPPRCGHDAYSTELDGAFVHVHLAAGDPTKQFTDEKFAASPCGGVTVVYEANVCDTTHFVLDTRRTLAGWIRAIDAHDFRIRPGRGPYLDVGLVFCPRDEVPRPLLPYEFRRCDCDPTYAPQSCDTDIMREYAHPPRVEDRGAQEYTCPYGPGCEDPIYGDCLRSIPYYVERFCDRKYLSALAAGGD